MCSMRAELQVTHPHRVILFSTLYTGIAYAFNNSC